MKKWLIGLMAVVLAMPVFTTPVAANEAVVYEDGEYDVTAQALRADSNNPSGAAKFMNEDAKINVKDGNAFLVITIPDNPMAEISGLQIEGIEPVETKRDNARDLEFALQSLKPELSAQVQYEVPSIDMKGDEPFRFVLEGLENITVVTEPEEEEDETPTEPEQEEEDETPTESEQEEEDETPTEPEQEEEDETPAEPEQEEEEDETPTEPEQEEEDETPTEPEKGEEEEETSTESGQEANEVDFVEATEDAQYINFITDSPAVNRQFDNPAVVFEKDGKTYIHLSGTGAQFFKSLAIDETPVVWGEVNEENEFTVQFEHTGDLSDELVMNMVIAAGPREMVHDVPFTFDVDSLTPVNPTFIEATEDAQYINFVTDSAAVNRQFDNPAVVFDKDGKTYIHLSGTGAQFFKSLAINEIPVVWGEVNEENEFTVQFEHTGDLSDELVMNMVIAAGPREMSHDVPFTFDVDSLTPVNEDENQTPPVNKGDSDDNNTPPVDKEDEADEEQTEDTPHIADKAYSVNYIIKHETEDKASAAFNFFNPQAVILEIDGEKYVQISTTDGSGKFIDSLKVLLNGKFVEMVKVEESEDGPTVYQFKLDGNLSDEVLLEMTITVPGVYDGEVYETRLFFDEETVNEENPNDYQLVASTNENGPDGKSAVTPEQGEPKENGKPTPSTNGNNGKGGNNDSKQQPTPEKENQIIADQAHSVNYIIKHETEDKASAAFNFFNPQAVVLEIDDEKYVQIWTTPGSGQYIESLRALVDGKFVEMVRVDGENGGPTLFQFKLDDELSDMVLLDMVISVPGIYDEAYYKARLFFDVDSVEEVAAEDYPLVASTNANGPEGQNPVDPKPKQEPQGEGNGNGKINLDPRTPAKPSLGDAEDGDVEENGAAADKDNLNPKTGEETNVLLYVLLLLASAIPLVIKAKRRFV